MNRSLNYHSFSFSTAEGGRKVDGATMMGLFRGDIIFKKGKRVILNPITSLFPFMYI